MNSTMEMPVDRRPLAAPTAARRRPWWRQLGADTTYNLTALAFAIPVFVVVVTGTALGLGLTVLLFGIPILAGTLYAARGFAHVERVRIRNLVGVEAPTPVYRSIDSERSWLARAATPLRDPQSWFDFGWTIISFATSIVTFSVTLVWWAATLGGLTYWYWEQFIPYEDDNDLLVEILNLGEGRGAESVLMLVFGVFALVTLPFVVRACALGQAGVGRTFLSSRHAESAPVDR